MKTLFTLILTLILLSDVNAQSLDSLFKTVKYRNIGPFRGGRSVAVSGVVNDPITYYMGTTGGGLWKTEDAGQRWINISDGYFTTGSVGAIAVSESNPNIVYVGMGEHAPRAVMTSYGDGVYKSYDAGKTWVKLGLEKTQQISRIVIHPENPDILYVAAQGAIYGPNPERGIYKSIDGGTTWEKILFVNNLTGCSELSMDLSNPQVLYAAMWEHQRKPWQVISGGEGSGLYKTSDAGKTWKKIHNGLPKEMGKMAIAVSRSNPNKVYALIESDWEKDKGGLYVSQDAGKKWSQVSKEHKLISRAWFYTEVFSDPTNENVVYVLNAGAYRSIDGGKTWSRITGTHGDYHDLWINPSNSKNMVIGNDGGAAISFNFAKSWSTQANMPTAQFYRVNVDNAFPYRLYGGQQDNSSVRIESMSVNERSIGRQNWTRSAGFESAFLAFDPDDPRFVLGGNYQGYIEVLDYKSKAGNSINAYPAQNLARDAKDMKYRYNWNAPIIWSKHEPNTFYHAAQCLLRTKDLGISWEEVSPDLTRNEKEKQGKAGVPYTNEGVGAENYGTISYVIESPHEKGVIIASSDDGLIHITRDGTATWQNITPKGLEECLINAIDISPHDPGTFYIATTRYKFNDYTPALYKTNNYGKTWKNISNGIPYGAFTRVVREDEVRKDLLFAGTETGIYISWNGGEKWESFNLNLPVTPITDLIIRHNDVIVATSGRSFWILDDLELLRQYKEGDNSLKLYKPADAILGNWSSPLNKNSGKGTNTFEGVNPANGLVTYYMLPKLPKDTEVILEIKDQNDSLVRRISSKKDKSFKKYPGGPSSEPKLPAKKGINRFVWDLRHATMTGAPTAFMEGSYRGHKVTPGNYTMTLKAGTQVVKSDFSILTNPLYEIPAESYAEYDNFMKLMATNLNEMQSKVNTILKMRKKIVEVLKDIPKNNENEDIRKKGKELIAKMKAWDDEMVQRKTKSYDDVINFPNKFIAQYFFLINSTRTSLPRVNDSNKERHEELYKQWGILKTRAMEIIDTDVPNYNKLLHESGIGVIR